VATARREGRGILSFSVFRKRSHNVATEQDSGLKRPETLDFSVSDKDRIRIDRRYFVSGRRRYDKRAMRVREYVRHDDKTASRLAPKASDGRFDFSVAMNGGNDWLDLERSGRRLK
jgi:hypothetical protein